MASRSGVWSMQPYFAGNEMTEDRRTCFCCFFNNIVDIYFLFCCHQWICTSSLFFLFKKYYHGESIAVNVLVDNNTTKSVRKIKISGMCNIHHNYARKLNLVYWAVSQYTESKHLVEIQLYFCFQDFYTKLWGGFIKEIDNF